ncbi:MAG: hypothetical protein ACOZAR_03370 [Patescibacteria group bacterium]
MFWKKLIGVNFLGGSMKGAKWVNIVLGIILGSPLVLLVVFSIWGYIADDLDYIDGSQVENLYFTLVNYLLGIGFLISLIYGLYLLGRYIHKKDKEIMLLSWRYLLLFPVVVFLLYCIVVTVQMVIAQPGVTSCYIISGDVSWKRVNEKSDLLAKFKNNLPADVLEKIDRG